MRFKNYKLVNKWPRAIAIFSFFLLIPIGASADGIVDALIKPIFSFFIAPLVWALQLELVLLKIVASYNNFAHEGGVILGWIALRDLSNMFFILILLVIAFATILRISSYGYQQLLKRTILIAIFINFSKTIVGFLIDIVQIVMLTFISAIDQVITSSVVVAIGLGDLFSFSETTVIKSPEDKITAMIMATVFLAILVIIMAVMVMMLMMRIVALWVAIVMAPLAFVASIFPATKHFYSTWLKELGSNLVSGPMLAFFLWLTFSIVGGGAASKTFLGNEPVALDSPTKFLKIGNMVNYIIAISLLLTGLKMAAASGAAGASLASKGGSLIQNGVSKVRRGVTQSAAFGAKTLYSGRSGEGMIKGGAGRLRGLVGQKMVNLSTDKDGNVKSGKLDGLVMRAGMRRVGTEEQRRQRKTAYRAKRGENVQDQEKYWGSKKGVTIPIGRGKTVGGNEEAEVLTARAALKSGRAIDPTKAEDYKKAFDSVGDTASSELLKTKSAAIHDDVSMQNHINENGLSSLQRMNMEGIKPTVLEGILKNNDSGDIAKVVATMDKGNQEVFMAEIEKNKGEFDEERDSTGKPAALSNKDSARFKATTLQAQFDGKNTSGAIDTYNTLKSSTNSDDNVNAAAILKVLRKDMTGKQILKLDAGSELFKDLSSAPTGIQFKEMVDNGSSDQVKEISKNMISKGNINLVLNNDITSKYVDDTDVQNYFNTEVNKDIDKGKKDATGNVILEKRTAAEKAVERVNLAMKDLKQAHLVYGNTNDTDFAKLINDKLKKDDIGKIDTEALKRLQGLLNPEKIQALVDLNIIKKPTPTATP